MIRNLNQEARETKENLQKFPTPLFILIGGVFGVGKTTLAYNLSNKLHIMQRASVGVITKTIKYFKLDPMKERLFDTIEHNDKNFLAFDEKSLQICNVVAEILKTAAKDGVDYILDGVQLVPRYLSPKIFKYFYIYLKAPSESALALRLTNSTTHKKRYKNVTKTNVKKLIDLDQHILNSINKNSNNILIIDSSQTESKILKEALKSIASFLRSQAVY